MFPINMEDSFTEARELLIEMGLIRSTLAKNKVFVDSIKVLEVMYDKHIPNPYDAIFDIYGVNASDYFQTLG